MFFTIIVCLLLITLAFSLTVARIDSIKDSIRDSGVVVTKELSQMIRIPLLEGNAKPILNIFYGAIKDRGILSGTVLNHRNEIVANVGEQATLLEDYALIQSIDQVSIWESKIDGREKIIRFSSDVSYDGTKIGEVYISISEHETSKIWNQFILTIALILLFLFTFTTIKFYKEIISRIGKLTTRTKSWPDTRPELEVGFSKNDEICPLCGRRNNLSVEIFDHSYLENASSDISKPDDESFAVTEGDAEAIYPRELCKREDFSWLRRQMILRFSEIILKLTK